MQHMRGETECILYPNYHCWSIGPLSSISLLTLLLRVEISISFSSPLPASVWSEGDVGCALSPWGSLPRQPAVSSVAPAWPAPRVRVLTPDTGERRQTRPGLKTVGDRTGTPEHRYQWTLSHNGLWLEISLHNWWRVKIRAKASWVLVSMSEKFFW